MDGTYAPPQKRQFDIYSSTLYAALSGLRLEEPLELVPGVTLRPAYSFLIQSQVIAFRRPPKPRIPHPGPWASLIDDGIESEVEIVLAEGAPRYGFDRPNTVWFLICLLRLRTGRPLHATFLSDGPLTELAESADEANLLPLETSRSRLSPPSSQLLLSEEIAWLREHFENAAKTMREPNINRAVQTVDRAIWHGDFGAGVSMSWAAIEALIRPGENQITDRVSKGLATLLADTRSDRDRLFSRIKNSYKSRGSAVHGGRVPERAAFEEAISFARQALLRTFELGEAPEIGRLLDCWRSQTPYT